jgi:hypothetical protein
MLTLWLRERGKPSDLELIVPQGGHRFDLGGAPRDIDRFWLMVKPMIKTGELYRLRNHESVARSGEE